MGFFNFKKSKRLILDINRQDNWPAQIIEHKELGREIAAFLRDLENHKEELRRAISNFEKQDHVPQEILHLTTQHAKILNEKTKRLLEQFTFTTDPFTYGADIERSMNAITEYKEGNLKHYSALKEHFEKEVKYLVESIQDLEDRLINLGGVLDQNHYEAIMTIREMNKNVRDLLATKRRYEKTLNKYLSDKAVIEAKQEKHRQKIKIQLPNIRTEEALTALKRIKEIDSEKSGIVGNYERLIFDTKHFLIKNNLKLSHTTKELFEKLKKDPVIIIQKLSESLKNEFNELYATLVNMETHDSKNVIGRLKDASENIFNDALKLDGFNKELPELKKIILSDIGALNVYEQEQFIARLNRELSDVQEKINFISEELESLDCQNMKEEITSLAKTFEPEFKDDAAEEKTAQELLDEEETL